jgi:hypothetical protein
MQALSGFARKYAIMEELDEGFSAGSTPEAFVRLDCWEGRIQASLNVKGLKQGPYTYKLYLIFVKGDRLVPILAGATNTSYSGMQGGLEVDADTMKFNGLKPESVRFAAITAESQDKKWIPLFASFEKSYKWDESIRQVLLRKPMEEVKKEEENSRNYFAENNTQSGKQNQYVWTEDTKKPVQETKAVPQQENPNIQPSPQQTEIPVKISSPQAESKVSASGNNMQRQAPSDNRSNKCDIIKLEGFLQNNFEVCEPFKRASRGYSWHRVSDLAKLSNIMYMSGVNVPVFANPKILVGLFKYKHILAGLYRGDNGANYFVIGVPAKDENDNKPFENACRWVPMMDSTIRDMGGYWLVYVSLRSGEIVV